MNEDPAPATILVVDDEPPLLRLLARVLERQGYSVLTARDGDEALDLFDKHLDAIDVVVLDVMIPPNGIAEVLDHMVSAHGGLAVILSSGDLPDPAISTRVKTYGGVFLRKPFLPKALLELVETGIQAKYSAGDQAENQPRRGPESEESGPPSGLPGNRA